MTQETQDTLTEIELIMEKVGAVQWSIYEALFSQSGPAQAYESRYGQYAAMSEIVCDYIGKALENIKQLLKAEGE